MKLRMVKGGRGRERRTLACDALKLLIPTLTIYFILEPSGLSEKDGETHDVGKSGARQDWVMYELEECRFHVS